MAFLIPMLIVGTFFGINYLIFGNFAGPEEVSLGIMIALFSIPISGLMAVILGLEGVLSTLFFLDSHGKVGDFFYSLFRGIKMFLYNMPFFIIFMGMMGCLLFMLVGFIGLQWTLALMPFVLPLPLCFIVNFYTKKLHEQFPLYFKPVSNQE